MVLTRAFRRILFTKDQENDNTPREPPQPNEREPVTRSSSLTRRRWWLNRSSSRKGPRISEPFDPFPVLAANAQDFDSRITSTSLSQILLWYMYYDVVQVPERNSKWFQDLPRESMVGWIGLGMELKRTNSFPTKKLKLACDKLKIDARQVVARLVRLSDRTSMLHSSLDTKTTYATQFEELTSDLELVESLRPNPQTDAGQWKLEIKKCIQDYMQVVYLKVLNIGQFELEPAITRKETRRRNDVRKRLDQVCNAPRHPPKDFYDEAQEMLGGNWGILPTCQRISTSMSVLALSDGGLRSKSPNGSERGGIPGRGNQLDQSDTRRRSAPDLNDLECILNQMRVQCSRFAEELRQIRLQQGPTSAIQRADSLNPSSNPAIFQHKAARNLDLDINHGGHPVSDRNGTCFSHQPDAIGTATTDPYESHHNRMESNSTQWLQNERPRTSHTHQSHTYFSEDPSSHSLARHGQLYSQSPITSDSVGESSRQQHDATKDLDNEPDCLRGQASNALHDRLSQFQNTWLVDGPSFVPKTLASRESIAAVSVSDDPNWSANDPPTPTEESSLFMTPPSSPTLSMLSMPWWKTPGAWPPASEAERSHLGSPLRTTSSSASISDSIGVPSRATVAGYSDITDPGQMAEAIRVRTRRAMATMVDLSYLPSRCSRSPERHRDAELNENEGPDLSEAMKGVYDEP